MSETRESHTLHLPNHEVRIDLDDGGEVWVIVGNEYITWSEFEAIYTFGLKHAAIDEDEEDDPST